MKSNYYFPFFKIILFKTAKFNLYHNMFFKVNLINLLRDLTFLTKILKFCTNLFQRNCISFADGAQHTV